MIRLVEHDPLWNAQFEREAARIRAAAGDAVIALHHIGSTAIPTIWAKPIIDLLLETTSIDTLDASSHSIEALGYEALGEFGIAGRRYFRRDDAHGVRTHQIHAFHAGVPDVIRHLAFRDYMRAHPSVATEYGALKCRLAAAHSHDLQSYNAGKDAFVKEHESRALLWAVAPAPMTPR